MTSARQNSSTNKRNRPRRKPKGRQVDENALRAVQSTLGDGPFVQDHLIEYLHVLNDTFGYLSADHITALAYKMGLAQIDVYETATFYAHFTVVKEGDIPPPSLTLRICDGPACRMFGAKKLFKDALSAFEDKVQVVTAPCQGACDTAPSAILGRRRISPACLKTIDPETTALNVTEAKTKDTPTPPKIISQKTASTPNAPSLLKELERANLRGLGGAGFPTAKKWEFFKNAPHPRVLVVNADEGEPGTFKDRYLLETHRAQVLVGIKLAAQALHVQDVYIYLRDEYAHLHHALQTDLSNNSKDGFAVHLRRGAGAYICGEETALLESLEGKRGLPRNRPPFPAQSGFMGRPTIIQNVETLYWISRINEQGADWYSGQGHPRFYSISGRVRQPGVYAAPSSTTVLDLIESAGGMSDGHRLKAFLPGGASGGIFPARFADKAMDFGVFEAVGGFVGSGALTILSDHDDVWDVARNLCGFFADESCGQCTPCRVGTQKMIALIQNPHDNEDLIRSLATVMRDTSICGLGQAAPNPIITILDHMKDET